MSAQTVYNTFGSKPALLKAAYDITLAGDAQGLALAARPEVRQLYAETDAEAFLRGYARLGRTLLDRVGPLMLQIAAGTAAGDPDLVALRRVWHLVTQNLGWTGEQYQDWIGEAMCAAALGWWRPDPLPG